MDTLSFVLKYAYGSLSESALYFSNRTLFSFYIASSKHEDGLGEFETVMQTRGYVSGLHNFRDDSLNPPRFF